MDVSVQKCAALCKVADSGSFTAAARALGYSQSSISRMVADLEGEWGVRLVERKRSGVGLTDEGAKLLPYARKLCAQQDDLLARVEDMKGNVAGRLRIGTISSIAAHWLPPVVAAFEADYPQISYELLIGDYTEIEQWILQGRVDCGFVRLPAARGLEAISLAQDELYAVVPVGHPLADREFVSPRDLCEYSFLSLSENDDVEDAGIFDDLAVKPKTRVSTWDDYCIMAMVESGLGVSVLPGLILKRISYEVEVRPLNPRATRELAFAVRGGGYASLAVQRFVGYLDMRGAGPLGCDVGGPAPDKLGAGPFR